MLFLFALRLGRSPKAAEQYLGTLPIALGGAGK